MTALVPSPNVPRPPEGSLAWELADMLCRIERNYGREGSGPGTRFEGRLLEDVQAEALLRRVAEFVRKRADDADEKWGGGSFSAAVLREFADLLERQP